MKRYFGLNLVPMATESPFHSPASYMATLFTNSRLREQDKAYYYNELAASYVPNNAAIEYNRKYFRGVLINHIKCNRFRFRNDLSLF